MIAAMVKTWPCDENGQSHRLALNLAIARRWGLITIRDFKALRDFHTRGLRPFTSIMSWRLDAVFAGLNIIDMIGMWMLIVTCETIDQIADQTDPDQAMELYARRLADLCTTLKIHGHSTLGLGGRVPVPVELEDGEAPDALPRDTRYFTIELLLAHHRIMTICTRPWQWIYGPVMVKPRKKGRSE
jgi:hypothetical protein